jgi:hypothetical protein
VAADGPTAPAAAAAAWSFATVGLSVGAMAAAVALAPPSSAAPSRGLVWLLFFGSSVHVASTGWLFTRPEVRAYAKHRPARFVWVPLGLVVTAAAVAAMLTPSVMAWLLLPYFGWQFFHFHKQNLGLVALCASSRGLPGPSPAERRALTIASVASIAGLLAHPPLLQLALPVVSNAVFAVAGMVFTGAVVVGVILMLRRPPTERPAALWALYLLALGFSLPIFLFHSPYAAVGGMTVAHGLQYLLLVGLIAAGPVRQPGRGLRIAVLCTFSVVGGAVLAMTSHLHSAPPVGRLLFGVYLAVVMTHFVVDAGLWRLRDPFPRAFLSHHLPYLVSSAPRATVNDDLTANATAPAR